MPAIVGCTGQERNEISGCRRRFGMGNICDASTAAEKRFKDKSGIWDGETKSRTNDSQDLGRRLIICLARGCGALLRAAIPGLE